MTDHKKEVTVFPEELYGLLANGKFVCVIVAINGCVVARGSGEIVEVSGFGEETRSMKFRLKGNDGEGIEVCAHQPDRVKQVPITKSGDLELRPSCQGPPVGLGELRTSAERIRMLVEELVSLKFPLMSEQDHRLFEIAGKLLHLAEETIAAVEGSAAGSWIAVVDGGERPGDGEWVLVPRVDQSLTPMDVVLFDQLRKNDELVLAEREAPPMPFDVALFELGRWWTRRRGGRNTPTHFARIRRPWER